MTQSNSYRKVFSLISLQNADYKAWRLKLQYPQSLMRNTARSGCQTDYATLPDIDMIPNKGLDLQLEDFLSGLNSCTEDHTVGEGDNCTRCDKCAFVLPVYEISTNATKFPEDKTELLDLLSANMSREFHKVS